MAKKIKFSKLYWSIKQPVPTIKIVNRFQTIRDGAGDKGAEIGSLGAGVQVVIDENEHDNGWYRIISVEKWSPVPSKWIERMADTKPEEDWEWWIDQTALSDITPGPNPILRYEIGINRETGEAKIVRLFP